MTRYTAVKCAYWLVACTAVYNLAVKIGIGDQWEYWLALAFVWFGIWIIPQPKGKS